MLKDIEKENLAKKIKGVKSTTEKIKILLTEKLNSDYKNREKIKEEIKQKIKDKEIHKDIFYGYQVASDMWDLAGDKSADLNYYSKRLILVSVYSNILFKILTCKTYRTIWGSHFIKPVSSNTCIKITDKRVRVAWKISDYKRPKRRCGSRSRGRAS